MVSLKLQNTDRKLDLSIWNKNMEKKIVGEKDEKPVLSLPIDIEQKWENSEFTFFEIVAMNLKSIMCR